MKKCLVLLLLLLPALTNLYALPAGAWNPLLAPGSLSETSATLLWNKQSPQSNSTYQVLLNGKVQGTTQASNYTFTNLQPNTSYTVEIKLTTPGSNKPSGNTLRFTTAAKGKVYNILDYGAKDDTAITNTRAIQAAIDACTTGGTVYIPKGVFISGALHLKSNMTLYIEKDGVLKGSGNIEEYLPMILNRFEGWELKTYASLINAGTLNRDGSYNAKNIRITGGGTIMGGGQRLGNAMTKASGNRSRGRLICLINCQDVSISNLTITEPPSWTIHYIYSNNISTHNLNIITKGIHNGDGIDPDSSTDCYIFNCTFDTGDDCIAIKSGKNPEGFIVGKPTKNVRVTNCNFKRGHGISIGSEMSGGVSDVLVEDCQAGALLHGMQIKGTKDRGGYVKNVTVNNCQLLKITVFSAVNYNNDGEPAPETPTYSNFTFENIDLSAASEKEAAININGFKDPAHRLKNVYFNNIKLSENATILVKDAEKVTFTNIQAANNGKPQYTVNNSIEVTH
ncbi:Polygalacturonase [Filimonas lacunae]|uniref:Polygalacturonase n=1 Tax=Filimonas lacunae TaxID=477680 RepID=A0A173M979_9BACT|nr:glycoside hydrolase family 28 protein [Filimonas lacunae]BAV04097.1 polygalacturonase [Filimonas lacunae]SIT15491.1 Polygalacturonase [Filimonas lacunae]